MINRSKPSIRQALAESAGARDTREKRIGQIEMQAYTGELSGFIRGNAEHQMLIWDNTAKKWILLAAPTDEYTYLSFGDGDVKWDYPRMNSGDA